MVQISGQYLKNSSIRYFKFTLCISQEFQLDEKNADWLVLNWNSGYYGVIIMLLIFCRIEGLCFCLI